LGTPGYLSPEVARGERADARSDVFALGAVTFFMLTGSPPFKGDSLADVLYAHIHEPAPSIATLRGETIPAAVEQIVERALAKDPSDRFRDAAEFGSAIERSGLADAWSPAAVSREPVGD
jgi:serine/threonine-protein kinase